MVEQFFDLRDLDLTSPRLASFRGCHAREYLTECPIARGGLLFRDRFICS